MTEVCSPNKAMSLTVALETTSPNNTLGTYNRLMESTTPHSLRKSVNRASKAEVPLPKLQIGLYCSCTKKEPRITKRSTVGLGDPLAPSFQQAPLRNANDYGLSRNKIMVMKVLC
jgi:hypothetical protein